MSPASHLESGNAAERQAETYLHAQGLTTLSRNYRCKGGELDLVMRSPQGEIIFVEVRYRRSASHGGALASIDWRKQRRIIHAAQHYLLTHRLQQQPCRIDVLLIQGSQNQQTRLEWLRNAIEVA